jgi:hypothetical protein
MLAPLTPVQRVLLDCDLWKHQVLCFNRTADGDHYIYTLPYDPAGDERALADALRTDRQDLRAAAFALADRLLEEQRDFGEAAAHHKLARILVAVLEDGERLAERYEPFAAILEPEPLLRAVGPERIERLLLRELEALYQAVHSSKGWHVSAVNPIKGRATYLKVCPSPRVLRMLLGVGLPSGGRPDREVRVEAEGIAALAPVLAEFDTLDQSGDTDTLREIMVEFCKPARES